MYPLEFDSQVQRLRNHWSDRQYTSEFCTLLFKAMKNLPDGVFTAIVDEVILNCARPALLQDFADIAMRFASNRSQTPLKIREKCDVCSSHGYFLAKNNESGSIITASCESCSTGRDLRERSKHPIIGLSRAKAQGWERVKVFNEDLGEKWASTKAPGTPAIVESLCEMIETGRTAKRHKGAFGWALRSTSLSESESWKVYESWKNGEVHPLALKNKPSIIKALTGDIRTQNRNGTGAS